MFIVINKRKTNRKSPLTILLKKPYRIEGIKRIATK